MTSSRRSECLVVFALAVGGAGCLGTIEFDARESKRPPRAKSNVAVYVVDCSDPTPDLRDCSYNGASPTWKVLGTFRSTPRAAGRWIRYRSEVSELAANKGCPGVAIRRDPPVYAGGKAIGAFCVDAAASADATPTPSSTFVAAVASHTSTAPSSTGSANAASEEEHIVTTVANGVAYFDLGVRNGLHVGSRVEIVGDDGEILATVQTDLCGEIVCRAQLSPSLVKIVKRGLRVRAVSKP